MDNAGKTGFSLCVLSTSTLCGSTGKFYNSLKINYLQVSKTFSRRLFFNQGCFGKL
ncbi:hypothetical protein BN2497_6973 [Janthinobacterium sp. CG23_2]|nr:hypothetical protein BN2497_6973 [Janthinobacterium sp. CG23_2]CUU29884.1 hypothetical protein BN3177_6973 [Janthinobacterium sp. CG23_2]